MIVNMDFRTFDWLAAVMPTNQMQGLKISVTNMGFNMDIC